MTTQHNRQNSVDRLVYGHVGSPSKRRRISLDQDVSDDPIPASSISPEYRRASFYNPLHSYGFSRKDRVKEKGGIRRRRSSEQDYNTDLWPDSFILPDGILDGSYGMNAMFLNGPDSKDKEDPKDQEESITISATSKQATQTVAPFLAKHIPEQYKPMSGMDPAGDGRSKGNNTKYCYRHRPDLKCRRQANEPSMDQLQHVSVSV